MVVRELYKYGKKGPLYRTFSDRGLMLRKSGTEEMYTEAVDCSLSYSYEETETEESG